MSRSNFHVLLKNPENLEITDDILFKCACLAKENWNEAFKLFYHKNFTNIINSNETKELMIYRGMVASKPSNQNLEEFWIGIKKREVIRKGR